MTYRKFGSNDVFHNVIVANPDYQFIANNKRVYLNRESLVLGNFNNTQRGGKFIKHIGSGSVSLHELNINRPNDAPANRTFIYPFITKESARTSFSTITTSKFQDSSQFMFGDVITGSYPMSASISRIWVPSGAEFGTHNFQDPDNPITAASNKKYIRALRNPIEQGSMLSPAFTYGSKGTSNVNLVCIPSIFYGSEIKKGSVQLDFFITGTLMAQLKDTAKNGELIETTGPQVGSIPGIVLYEQGIIILTGSYNLSTNAASQDKYFENSTANPTWLAFGAGFPEAGTATSQNVTHKPTFSVRFKGTNKIPTLTMLAHALPGELNYSHNPTFVDNENQITSSISQSEYEELPGKVKNIVKSNFTGHDESFKNTTYISKIGIYDEDRNLIAVASLANPVKKTETREYTFKMRMDF